MSMILNRAIERLAGDPVNSVDLQNRSVRIPMEEGNIVTLQATGTKKSPSFILEDALMKFKLKKLSQSFILIDHWMQLVHILRN